ncbi:MAG: hypothetical protein ACXWKP_23155 [Bradyrhizobium sp.]
MAPVPALSEIVSDIGRPADSPIEVVLQELQREGRGDALARGAAGWGILDRGGPAARAGATVHNATPLE